MSTQVPFPTKALRKGDKVRRIKTGSDGWKDPVRPMSDEYVTEEALAEGYVGLSGDPWRVDAGGRFIGVDSTKFPCMLVERNGRRVTSILMERLDRPGNLRVEYADGTREVWSHATNEWMAPTYPGLGNEEHRQNHSYWSYLYQADKSEPFAPTDEQVDAALAELKREYALCERFDAAVERAKVPITYLERLKIQADEQDEVWLYDELIAMLQPEPPKVWKVGDVVPGGTRVGRDWLAEETATHPRAFLNCNDYALDDRTILWIEDEQ